MLRFSSLLALSLAIGVAHGSNITASAASRACAQLTKALGPSIVHSRVTNDTTYDASAHGAWSVFNQQDDPTCIVFPTSAQHVVSAMRTFRNADASYSIRGGGHSAMPGWNTIEEGVLIDFSKMKNISYNPHTASLTLEPGALWGEVYDYADQYGVTAVGGRVLDVGVSGLILGGGFSFLAGSKGWAADALQSVDIVLASGELVTATAKNRYKDLFKAIKGSGGRLGIVTKYVVDAVPVGKRTDKTWYGGAISYALSSAEDVINAFDDFIQHRTGPKSAILLYVGRLNIDPANPIFYVEAELVYNGTAAEFNATFSKFLEIPNSGTAGPISYYDATQFNAAGGFERVNGQAFTGTANYPGGGVYIDSYHSWLNYTASFPNELYSSVHAYTAVSKSSIEVGKARGGNVIDAPDRPYASVHTQSSWAPGYLQPSPEITAGLALHLSQMPASPGLPLYLNECEETQKVLRTYGGYEELKAIYAKYDPSRFIVSHSKGPVGL